jgi:hypothetical protein
MKQKAIEILIELSGAIQIDAVGFNGSDCEKATAFLEQALGTLQQKQHKPEYYRQAHRKEQQKVGA